MTRAGFELVIPVLENPTPNHVLIITRSLILLPIMLLHYLKEKIGL